MRKLLMILIVGLFSVSAMQCDSPPPVKEIPKTLLPEVSITLLGSTKDITAKGLQPDEMDRFIRSGSLIKPHRLIIHFLGQSRTTLLPVRITSMILYHGVIKSIYFSQPIERTSYREALAALEQTVSELKIDPANHLKEQISKWPKDIPKVGRVGLIRIRPYATIPVTKEIDFTAELVANPSGTKPRRAWLVLMNISANLQTVQAAVFAATHPSTQPTTYPSTLPTHSNPKLKAWKDWRKTHDKIDLDRLLNDPNYGPRQQKQ